MKTVKSEVYRREKDRDRLTIRNQVVDQVSHKIWSQVSHQVWRRTTDLVLYLVGDQIRDALWEL